MGAVCTSFRVAGMAGQQPLATGFKALTSALRETRQPDAPVRREIRRFSIALEAALGQPPAGQEAIALAPPEAAPALSMYAA